jgi:cytochrome P450
LTSTFENVVAEKSASPAADLISGWILADALSKDELVSPAFLTMMAGLENAVYLNGNVLAALVNSPERADVVADWARRRGPVIEQANPVPFAIRRFAVTDLEIGGRTIPAGDTVLLPQLHLRSVASPSLPRWRSEGSRHRARIGSVDHRDVGWRRDSRRKLRAPRNHRQCGVSA